MSISTNNRIYVKLQKTYHILYYISKCDVSKLSYLSITKISQAAQGTCKKIIDIISLAHVKYLFLNIKFNYIKKGIIYVEMQYIYIYSFIYYHLSI